jgi:hypothetical protein
VELAVILDRAVVQLAGKEIIQPVIPVAVVLARVENIVQTYQADLFRKAVTAEE